MSHRPCLNGRNMKTPRNTQSVQKLSRIHARSAVDMAFLLALTKLGILTQSLSKRRKLGIFKSFLTD